MIGNITKGFLLRYVHFEAFMEWRSDLFETMHRDAYSGSELKTWVKRHFVQYGRFEVGTGRGIELTKLLSIA
jgi:hypothetical protein